MNDLLVLSEADFDLLNELPVCGCGLSDSVHDLYRAVLRVTPPSQLNRPEGYEWPDWDERVAATNGDALLYEVIAHVLAHIDATEHGSSVGGAWRTEKGDRLLDILDRYAENYDATPTYGDPEPAG